MQLFDIEQQSSASARYWRGGREIVATAVATAEGPPLRIIEVPVNTLVVDVPPELVSVTATRYVPGAA
jgi:hypothetical protein